MTTLKYNRLTLDSSSSSSSSSSSRRSYDKICGICFDNYNNDDHNPLCLFCCDKVIGRSCMNNIVLLNTSRCPWCDLR